jgi:hypothetical protein
MEALGESGVSLSSYMNDFVSSVCMVEWIVDMGYNIHDDRSFTTLVTGATRAGSVDVLEWLRGRDDLPSFPWCEVLPEQAAAADQLKVLQWLGTIHHPSSWTSLVCAMAALYNHLEVLQWLRAQNPPCPWDDSTLSLSAKRGHLAPTVSLGRMRVSMGCTVWSFRGIAVVACPESSLSVAARGVFRRHLAVLQWARSQNPPCPWDKARCIENALRSYRFEVLQWLHSETRLSTFLWGNSNLYEYAAKDGRIDMIAWLRSRDPPVPWDATVCATIAAKGHLQVLQWVRSQNPPCPIDSRAFVAAARNGRMSILEWLRYETNVTATNNLWTPEVCAAAAANDQLDTLIWLRLLDPPCPWDKYSCTIAVARGHLYILKWLRDENRPPCPWDAECQRVAGKNGHEDVVDWIYEHNPSSEWDFDEHTVY